MLLSDINRNIDQMALSIFTSKIPIVGKDAMCILNSEWKADEAQFWLLHESTAWSGQFQIKSNEEVAEIIDQLSLTEESYLNETKKALTTQGGLENFAYSINEDKLVWKKYVRANMAVKFGFINLRKVPLSDVIDKIVDQAIATNLNLNERLSKSESQSKAFKLENTFLKVKINDLTNKKIEMESVLYSKFLCLLNEKKKKIESLKSLVQEKQIEPHNAEDSPEYRDPFDTDTDIDSELDEDGKNRSPKRTLKLEDEDDSDNDFNRCSLPKKSRGNRDTQISVAGPSGVKQRIIGGPSKSKTSPQKKAKLANGSKIKTSKSPSKTAPKTLRRSTRTTKPSCVLGEINFKEEKSNSEENAFNFPETSKATRKPVEAARFTKPSTGKIQYVPDDDEDTDEMEDVKMVSDLTPSNVEPLKLDVVEHSDSTPSGIVPLKPDRSINDIPTVKSENLQSDQTPSGIEPLASASMIQERLVSKIDKTEKNCPQVDLKKEGGKARGDMDVKKCTEGKGEYFELDTSFKNYSSSTLNILNQLM